MSLDDGDCESDNGKSQRCLMRSSSKSLGDEHFDFRLKGRWRL